MLRQAQHDNEEITAPVTLSLSKGEAIRSTS